MIAKLLLAGIVASAGIGGAKAANLEARILAQQGLNVALSNAVLQTMLYSVFNAGSTVGTCQKQPDGSAIETISSKRPSTTEFIATVGIYFDWKCTKPYVKIAETIIAQNGSSTISIAQTSSYTGLAGQVLGAGTLNASFTEGKTTTVIVGTGSFTANKSTNKATLGIACTFPNKGLVAQCQAGVAQNFASLKLSLASVTPLTLHAKALPNGLDKITYTAATSNMRTAALNQLSIKPGSAATLEIAGGGLSYGSAPTSGAAAEYTLFPPEPTYWTVTDKTHDAKYSQMEITKISKAATGLVRSISKNALLAKISVDRSGTGVVTYADKTRAAVTNWLLAN